jgi:hypothetical protein
MPRLTDGTVKGAGVGEHSDAQTPGLVFIVRASTSKTKLKPQRRISSCGFTLLGGKRQKNVAWALIRPSSWRKPAERRAKPRLWSPRAWIHALDAARIPQT